MPRITRTIGLAVGLLGGVVASQGPEFAQQYRQRLGGAVDELRRIVERFESDARATGQTRADAVSRLNANGDELVQRQGQAMQWTMDRLERFERQQKDFADAGPFGRILVMTQDYDRELAGATYRAFEPAVPATQEGLIAGTVGFVAGWGGFVFVGRVLRTLFWRRRQLRSA